MAQSMRLQVLIKFQAWGQPASVALVICSLLPEIMFPKPVLLSISLCIAYNFFLKIFIYLTDYKCYRSRLFCVFVSFDGLLGHF